MYHLCTHSLQLHYCTHKSHSYRCVNRLCMLSQCEHKPVRDVNLYNCSEFWGSPAKKRVMCGMIPCGVVATYLCFTGTCHLHQGILMQADDTTTRLHCTTLTVTTSDLSQWQIIFNDYTLHCHIPITHIKAAICVSFIWKISTSS